MVKDVLAHTEEKMSEMQDSLKDKDDQINFLRSMLGKLAERLEGLEKSSELRLGMIYCIQLWICSVLYSPYGDLRLIRPVLNSPTHQFSYIFLYKCLN